MVLKKYLVSVGIVAASMVVGSINALPELSTYQQALSRAQTEVNKGITSLDDYHSARSVLELAKKSYTCLNSAYYTKRERSSRFVAESHQQGLTTSYLNDQLPILDALEKQLNGNLMNFINSLITLLKKLQDGSGERDLKGQADNKLLLDQIGDLQLRLSAQDRQVSDNRRVVADLQRQVKDAQENARRIPLAPPSGADAARLRGLEQQVQQQMQLLAKAQEDAAQEQARHRAELQKVQEDTQRARERLEQDHRRALGEQRRQLQEQAAQAAQRRARDEEKIRDQIAQLQKDLVQERVASDKLRGQVGLDVKEREKKAQEAQDKALEAQRKAFEAERKAQQAAWDKERNSLRERLQKDEDGDKKRAGIQAQVSDEQTAKEAAARAKIKADEDALETQRERFRAEQQAAQEVLAQQRTQFEQQQQAAQKERERVAEEIAQERKAKDEARTEAQRVKKELDELRLERAMYDVDPSVLEARIQEQQRVRAQEAVQQQRQALEEQAARLRAEASAEQTRELLALEERVKERFGQLEGDQRRALQKLEAEKKALEERLDRQRAPAFVSSPLSLRLPSALPARLPAGPAAAPTRAAQNTVVLGGLGGAAPVPLRQAASQQPRRYPDEPFPSGRREPLPRSYADEPRSVPPQSRLGNWLTSILGSISPEQPEEYASEPVVVRTPSSVASGVSLRPARQPEPAVVRPAAPAAAPARDAQPPRGEERSFVPRQAGAGLERPQASR